MNDPAVWYLVIEMAATAAAPGRAPLIGPVTEKQCETVRGGIVLLEDVATARCRKAIGMMTCYPDGRAGATMYACPMFEGELAAPVASPHEGR